MGKKYIVEFNRTDCIGYGSCVPASPKHWILQADGKPRLTVVGGKKINKSDGKEHEELEIDEEDLQANKDAAIVCPVAVIKIREKESGKYVEL